MTPVSPPGAAEPREDAAGSASLSHPEDWADYWRRGWITSFAEQFPENYDGPIREFWQRQLAGAFEHIVDIGCGNGALTWIVDGIVNRPSGKTLVTGIDSAAIDPFESTRKAASDYPKVRFIGNTTAEKLPFAEQSVDLVVSLYGIEYTDLDLSIPEISRVLKPAGRMAFLMHNAESSVVSDATRYLDASRAVLSLGIHDAALELLELGRRLRTPRERQASAEFKALTAKLDRLTAQVRDIVRQHAQRSAIHSYMDGLMQVFARPSSQPGGGDQERIVAVRDAFRAHVRKMAHMKAAALSAERRERLLGLIEESGFAITEIAEVAYRHENNIGTALVAARAPR